MNVGDLIDNLNSAVSPQVSLALGSILGAAVAGVGFAILMRVVVAQVFRVAAGLLLLVGGLVVLALAAGIVMPVSLTEAAHAVRGVATTTINNIIVTKLPSLTIGTAGTAAGATWAYLSKARRG